MKSDAIFKFSYGRGDERHLANGTTVTCTWDTGHIVGSDLAFPAVVLPDYEEDSHWHLVNLINQNYAFLGVVAVLGAFSADQASDVALRSFNADFGGIARASDVVKAPAYVLKRLLNNQGRAQYNGMVTQEELNNIEGKVTHNNVEYVTSDSSQLASHSGYDDLMSDILRYDNGGLSLLKVTPEEIIKDELEGAETEQYDAIVSQVSRLDALSSRIIVAMGKASDKVKPINVTKTDPFKKNGVVNVAQVFEMDDGQTLTIVYHNPDATPKRLDAKDFLTSWKFLHNKRDVSVVLQPKSGKDINIPVLAKRMMQLIEANSARFKRTQERKIKAEVALDELSKIESERKAEIAELDKEIAELEQKLDTPVAEGIQQQVEQKIPENALANEDGDLYNKKTGKPFSAFSMARRFIAQNDLKGYVPMVANGGYVLHKFKDSHFQSTGKITVGNPAHDPSVIEAEPLLKFSHFGHDFMVYKNPDYSSKIEVISLKSRLLVMGDKAVDGSYTSAKSAYDDIIKKLNSGSEESFNASGIANALPADLEKSTKMATGIEAQNYQIIEENKDFKQELKRQEVNAELDKLRDENGKLNPLSDNPMERVRALEEMTFIEKMDFQEDFLKFINKSDTVDEKQVQIRKVELAKHYSNPEDKEGTAYANQFLLDHYSKIMQEYEQEPESPHYKVALDQVTKARTKLAVEPIEGKDVPVDPVPLASPDENNSSQPSKAETEKNERIRKYAEQFKTLAEQEIDTRKGQRPIDELLKYAKGLIAVNNDIGYELADALQHVLNAHPKLKQYHMVIPRNDSVTKGKIANKLRRLTKAFNEYQIPLNISKSKDSLILSGTDIRTFPRLEIHLDEDTYLIRGYEKDNAKPYGDLIPALLDYVNEKEAKGRIHVYFGRDGSIIDTASNQLGYELKNSLLDGVKGAFNQASQIAQTLDPALGAMAELSNEAPDLSLNTGVTSQPETLGNSGTVLDKIPELSSFLLENGFSKQTGLSGLSNEDISVSLSHDDETMIVRIDGKEVLASKSVFDVKSSVRMTLTKRNMAQITANNKANALSKEVAQDPEIIKYYAGEDDFGKTELIKSALAGRLPEKVKLSDFKKLVEAELSQQINQQGEAPMNDQKSKDEAYLDDIIAGNIDLAGLDMAEFTRVATPYAEDQSSTMYQKLEQALNAITQAKVAKAKAI